MNYGVIEKWPPTMSGAHIVHNSHDTERLSDYTQANSTVEMGSPTDDTVETWTYSVLLDHRFENDS